MGDQLPSLHAESKAGRCFGPPSSGYSYGWRLVEGGLQFDGSEIADVARVRFRPTAAADKERKFFHSEERTCLLICENGQVVNSINFIDLI